MTPEQLATIYVTTINGPANAWGQYCHPQYGQSHNIMAMLNRMVGDTEAQRLIAIKMSEARTNA